jgi:DNA-binding beta-propeller fold protein YncE
MVKPLLFSLLLIGFCLSAHGQSLLVVNQRDRNLRVIDPVSGGEIGIVAENLPGVWGHEIAASPDGRTAYMPIYGSAGVGNPGIDGHQLLVIDLASRKITGEVDFGHGVRPHLAVFDPTSGFLYVTTELDNSVTVIDPKIGKIVGAVPTGQEQSHMLALSHNGRRGYTANVGPGTVSVLDMMARKTVAIIPVSGKVQRISVSNDDKLVFTSDQMQPRLAVIDTASNRVTTWVALPGTGYGTAPTLDGHWLLVAIPSANKVAVIDLSSMRVVRSIDVPSSPQEILVRPDGKVAYVSCNRSGKIAAIDLSEWKVQTLIAAGQGADGLTWAM